MFESYRSYWFFAASVKARSRYIRTPAQEEFLTNLRDTIADKIETLKARTIMYRSQLGHDWRSEEDDRGSSYKVECPYGEERMKPLQDRAQEGRANPKGIPVLYLATHEGTAVAESRPWLGGFVSLGHFKLSKKLRVVNLTTEREYGLFRNEPSDEIKCKAVWASIDKAFARPVERSDDVADYAPTQLIAEYFRELGYDGIAYRSSLGPGHNLALFNIHVASLEVRRLVKVKKLTMEFDDADNPYFVAKQPVRISRPGASEWKKRTKA